VDSEKDKLKSGCIGGFGWREVELENGGRGWTEDLTVALPKPVESDGLDLLTRSRDKVGRFIEDLKSRRSKK
jgi:hypothetical protein